MTAHDDAKCQPDCSTCPREAIQNVEAELRRLTGSELKGRPGFHARRRDLLLEFFESAKASGDLPTLDAFLAYANAIGCVTTWKFNHTGPVFPLLTVEGCVEGGADLTARIVELVGTDEEAALKSFEMMFR